MASILLPDCAGGKSSVCSVTDAAKTSSYQSNKFSVAQFTQATIMIKTTATAGTSPTLNVYLQKLLPDGSTWHDIASFTQFTGNAAIVASLVSGGNKMEAQASASLAAGTINAVAFGAIWRFNYVIAGTSPSFTIQTALEMLA